MTITRESTGRMGVGRSPRTRKAARRTFDAGRLSRRTLTRGVIALILIVEIYPLLWLLSSSMKSENAFVSKPLWTFPHKLDFSNFSTAW